MNWFSQQSRVLPASHRHIFFLKTLLKYFSISGGSIETRRQEDVLHRFYAMKGKSGVVKKSKSVLQKRPQDFENSVKFDENANQWQTGEDSVFERQHQDLENSVKVDENGNVFLE